MLSSLLDQTDGQRRPVPMQFGQPSAPCNAIFVVVSESIAYAPTRAMVPNPHAHNNPLPSCLATISCTTGNVAGPLVRGEVGMRAILTGQAGKWSEFQVERGLQDCVQALADRSLLQSGTLLRRVGSLVRSYWIELETEEKTLLAFDPIIRIVPTTTARMTASITAYSATS